MSDKMKPILFSGPMIRAILDGKKSMTRRVVKPQPEPFCAAFTHETGATNCTVVYRPKPSDAPFQPGARLWVRETWRRPRINDGAPAAIKSPVQYRATSLFHDGFGESWRPSIFMPRWASRITLGVTAVKVERLQDISEEDAKAEGVRFDGTYWLGGVHPIKKTPQCWPTAKDAFKALWNSINSKRGYSWEANPWVWCYTFSREIANK
jgi:hypothetical protein